jgi:hypothetical protein
MLQRVGFNGRIGLLMDWDVIEGNLKSKIERLNGVRNQLAHSWSEQDVYYKFEGKHIRLNESLDQFRIDAKEVWVEVWVELIKIYMQAEVKDLGRLLVKLDDYNTFDAWTKISKRHNIGGKGAF